MTSCQSNYKADIKALLPFANKHAFSAVHCVFEVITLATKPWLLPMKLQCIAVSTYINVATRLIRLTCSRGFSGAKLVHQQHPGSISSTCLCAAFTRTDPESAKSCLTSMSFFALLGSVPVKAACKMLVKLTPCRPLLFDMTLTASG